MSNINRDYLIILDVKKGNVSSPNIYFFNTDKNTSNLYVQMVLRETTVEANPIENATDYSIKANILKPNMVGKIVEGNLVNEEKAIYEFKLPADCTDFSGNAKIEFEVYTGDKIATSFATKFKVHGSVLTEQNKYIEDSSDYPILKELMAEVKVINETAHELDTTIRTLQADMIEANNEMKANEVTRQANETTRVTNENTRKEAERIRVNQEAAREEAEAIREGQETTRVADESERKASENQRRTNEEVRASNEIERKTNEASRVSAENARATNEETRQTNEANREVAEQIRKANEEARITAETARVTEHEQMRTELNEVKAENAILMENDKKLADRMTQVEISDKRQYVIMEGLMNSAGDGYLKIEDTGNDTTLYNSVEGFVDVKNITGNTMVNSIKNPDDELTLNADINASGQSVTLTTAVDNGQVDVLAEGNTMVNVCDQQEAVAITKSYTVETGNHIALQGEYDGKARPVTQGNTLVNLWTNTNFPYNFNANDSVKISTSMIKTSTTYTAILNISTNTAISTQTDKSVAQIVPRSSSLNITSNNAIIKEGDIGIFLINFTTYSNPETVELILRRYTSSTEGELIIDNVVVLEGDYTNKPIPDYFTGMQSSFEDKVVTQEMVDSGKELAENLGKYKVEYKVTGKNKFNYFFAEAINKCPIATCDNNGVVTLNGTLKSHYMFDVCFPAGTYTPSCNPQNNLDIHVFWTGGDTGFGNSEHPVTYSKVTKVTCYINKGTYDNKIINSFQIEEGSTATDYEPYKESIKTYYLNSPLLEGDTIEESGGNVYHVHRYEKVVLDGSENWNTRDDITYGTAFYTRINGVKESGGIYCDKLINYNGSTIPCITNSRWGGDHIFIDSNLTTVSEFKTWLQANPVSAVYELKSPTYELISQNDSILIDSYVAGHLDFDTVVPVERVSFNRLSIGNKYLYPSTNYNIQFESDSKGKLRMFFGGGATEYNGDIIQGLNKLTIKTGDIQTSKLLYLDGIGFSASNIVVTEATDKDFGYFSGMKSVGELEENKIEILSRNKNHFIINENTSWSGNGISVKFNKDEQCIEINGTSTADSYFYANTYKYSVEGIKVGTNATLSARIIGDYDTSNVPDREEVFHLFVCSSLFGKFNSSENKFTDTYDNPSYNKGTMWIRFRIGAVYNNCKIYIQVEEGNTTTNYISPASNKKQILLNEPLRAIGDIKDRFVQIDGKWYVERNTAEIDISTLSWSDFWNDNFAIDGSFLGKTTLPKNANPAKSNNNIICDKLPVMDVILSNKIQAVSYADGNYRELGVRIIGISTLNDFLQWLKNNSPILTYALASPTYEPVEISPVLNTYTDVTHITNNSTIPMNMPIVNSGYEVIAKPSTKYTVVGIDNGRIGDSTIVNGTITTPATITDNFLRPYGTGKTSKVMLLEGEPANIPSYFKGIKSVFEDQLITEGENAGKYKAEVKVVGKNLIDKEYFASQLLKVSSITRVSFDGKDCLKINGILSAKRIKLCDDNTNIKTISMNLYTTSNDGASICKYGNYCSPGVNKWIKNMPFSKDNFVEIYNYQMRDVYIDLDSLQLEEGRVATEYEPYHETKQTLYLDEPLYNTNNITIYNDKLGYWKNYDIRDYQDGDFGTYLTDMTKTVYQLAEPEFVTLVKDTPNWIIGSWDNCSIHFDSIIPLATTRYRYTGNVPSVVAMSDDVAATKSISDEQDALLVDMATELAVMKLTM